MSWLIQNKGKILKLLLFLALVFPPVFLHLDKLPIRIWDEARLGVSAYEMHKSGNYLIPTYEGETEMWSVKPPLVIWLQVLFMKLIGINELAVRLPAALAAFLTTILMLWFCKKYFRSYWLGLISVLILITSSGYIGIHAARTGDYDVPLALFMAAYAICFFLFIESGEKKYLLLFFTALMLSVMTKSSAGLLFLPALFIYALLKKKISALLKMKEFYVGILIFLAPVLSYYLLRETFNPGYIKTVWEAEVADRYSEVIEGHDGGFWFYWQNFIERFSKWYLLIPCGIAVGIFHRNDFLKKFSVYACLIAVSHFFILSFAQTKCDWYDVPLFPWLSFIAGIFIWWVFGLIRDADTINNSLKKNFVPFLFLILLFEESYHEIINSIYFPKEKNNYEKEFYEPGYFLQNASHTGQNLNNCFLCYDGYHAQLLFYIDILKEKGINFDFADWKNLNPGDKIIASQWEVKKYIEENYVYSRSDNMNTVSTYLIHDKKQK